MQHGSPAAGGRAASGAATAGPGAARRAAARPDSEICMDFFIQTLRADVAGWPEASRCRHMKELPAKLHPDRW